MFLGMSIWGGMRETENCGRLCDDHPVSKKDCLDACHTRNLEIQPSSLKLVLEILCS